MGIIPKNGIHIYILDFMILFNMRRVLYPKMEYTFTMINKDILGSWFFLAVESLNKVEHLKKMMNDWL